MHLKTSHFYNIAKIIDNDFNGSEDTFTAVESNSVITLNTNKCDNCSIIKMELVNNAFEIKRIGADTEGWQKIARDTNDRVKGYFEFISTGE